MILKGWIFNFLKIQLTEFIIKSYYNQTIHPDIDSNNDETKTTTSKTPQIPSTTTNISQRDNCPIHSKTRIGNTPLTQCTSLDNALHANIPHPLAITHPLHRHSAHSPPFAPPLPPQGWPLSRSANVCIDVLGALHAIARSTCGGLLCEIIQRH